MLTHVIASLSLFHTPVAKIFEHKVWIQVPVKTQELDFTPMHAYHFI